MFGGTFLVVLATLAYWLTSGRYVSSDDSYVDAAKVSLSTDVSGLVAAVYVHDNQHVTAGQPLFSPKAAVPAGRYMPGCNCSTWVT